MTALFHASEDEQLEALQHRDYHPVIGYRNIPGIQARIPHENGPFLIRVNNLGFRSDRDFVPEKPPGVSRVLLFGDSLTEVFGVSNGSRFSDYLKELVPGLEVYNFGLGGTGTDQQYLIFREFASNIEHDLIVICPWLENIWRIVSTHQVFALRDGASRISARPYFSLEADGSLELHQVPVPRDPVPEEDLNGSQRVYWYSPPPRNSLLRRLLRRSRLRLVVELLGPRAMALARRTTRIDMFPEYERADDPSWRLMRAILERWVAELHAPAVVMPIPVFPHIEGSASPDGYRARFAELHRPPAVTVHDPLPDLTRVPRKDREALRISKRDSHPTREGHRSLAESLAPVIRSALPIPAR